MCRQCVSYRFVHWQTINYRYYLLIDDRYEYLFSICKFKIRPRSNSITNLARNSNNIRRIAYFSAHYMPFDVVSKQSIFRWRNLFIFSIITISFIFIFQYSRLSFTCAACYHYPQNKIYGFCDFCERDEFSINTTYKYIIFLFTTKRILNRTFRRVFRYVEFHTR